MAQIASVSYVITVSKMIKNDSNDSVSVDEFETSLEAIAQELVGDTHLVEVVKVCRKREGIGGYATQIERGRLGKAAVRRCKPAFHPHRPFFQLASSIRNS